ncbi:MAG: carboxypeptidase regulatory-like domain-containing protein [Phycisphaerae bacterium]|nr:carboxypeptidase regulatory-like domain-containing protein [Phycisphaerae bacterium]
MMVVNQTVGGRRQTRAGFPEQLTLSSVVLLLVVLATGVQAGVPVAPWILPTPEDHNCRMYGAWEPDMLGVSLYDHLWGDDPQCSYTCDFPRSLRCLSRSPQTNDDGWGIAYYLFPGDEPVYGRGAGRADDSQEYTDFVVENLSDPQPYITVAHVRNGTSGCHGDDVRNPHPFYRTQHRQTWTFAQNGGVNRNMLWGPYHNGNGGLLDYDYYAANPPNCSGLEECLENGICPDWNVVDSELYFLLLMQEIEEQGWNVIAGAYAAITAIRTHPTYINNPTSLNFLLSNGENLWAFRRDTNGTHPLYYLLGCGCGAAASEYPTRYPGNWESMNHYDYELVDLSARRVINLGGYNAYNRPPLLIDCAFNDSENSEELRDLNNDEGWYESREDDPTLLTLDTNDIGGNDAKKAALLNYGIAHNAYLAQEFTTAQDDFMSVSFDIYVDRIADTRTYDRTGLIYIGDDSVSTNNPPVGTSNERFVFMAFYDPSPETGGDLQIRARTSSSQDYRDTERWTSVATGLSYDTWYVVKIVLDIEGGSYDVYVDNALVANNVPKYSGYASSSVTHISFSADSDGQGDFYVDGVSAMFLIPPSPSISGTIYWPNGEPAPYVAMTARDLNCSGTWTTTTDADGHYHFNGLPATSYEIIAKRRVVCTNYARNICPIDYDGCNPVTVDLTLQVNGTWYICPQCPNRAPLPPATTVGDDETQQPIAKKPSVAVLAQSSITGTIFWNCGNPLETASYVEVTAKRVCHPDTYTARTDLSGYYRIFLPTGRYNMSARIRVNGVWYKAIACNVLVSGTTPVNVDLILRDSLWIECLDCDISILALPPSQPVKPLIGVHQ